MSGDESDLTINAPITDPYTFEWSFVIASGCESAFTLTDIESDDTFNLAVISGTGATSSSTATVTFSIDDNNGATITSSKTFSVGVKISGTDLATEISYSKTIVYKRCETSSFIESSPVSSTIEHFAGEKAVIRTNLAVLTPDSASEADTSCLMHRTYIATPSSLSILSLTMNKHNIFSHCSGVHPP